MFNIFLYCNFNTIFQTIIFRQEGVDKMSPNRIYSILKIILFILTSHSLLTRKKPIKYCVLTFILTTSVILLIGSYASSYITNEGILRFIMYFIFFFYLVYLHLVFEESISKKIFTFFSIGMFSTITLFIATPYAELISRIANVDYTQNLIYAFRISLNLLFLLAAYLKIGKHYKAILNLVSDKTISYMSLYPIMAFVLLITNFTTHTHISHLTNFNSIYDIILFILFILAGYLLVFVAISSSSQIISLKYDMDKLETISKTDSLTGLYNRRYIIEKIENEFANFKENNNHFSIIIADIDYFKKVNDSFGHDFGDQVLKIVSRNLKNTVGELGFVSRWGGEEFLILLPKTSIEDAYRLADKMRKISEDEIIDYNETQVSITLTFGVTVNEADEMIDDTIKKSDNALYKGKNQGRNCVVLC